MNTSHYDVIVIGAGQAGLAVGHYLAQQGRRFTILDAAAAPAAAWRERWDSLRLFTPTRFDSLPGKPFTGDPDHYPTRDELVAYLTDYASDLPVQLNSRVRALRRHAGCYAVELENRTYTADQVVVATGPFQTPRVPAIASGLPPDIAQFHSTAYRNPAQVAEGPVLVVGGGNTGYQIAEELAGSHDVHLSVGSRQKPMPQRILGRDVFRYLNALGALTKTADTRIGRRMKDGDTLVGSSPRRARKQGVQLRPRTTHVSGSTISFADGTQIEASTVIWATGFTRDYAWIDAPISDADGAVIQQRGVTPAAGLYFLGLPWMHSRGSALLGWVKDDAAHVAAHIAANATRPGTPNTLDLAA